ncbi:MAG: hypothetical protein PHI67_08690 [Candidatus Methanomethylophilaceae archaeon]|nr:hypothetical protein [Candidatus Methanomethylophilaceae archaeon]
MNLETMERMYCPWRNGNCLGEKCIACIISEQIPEDIYGEAVMVCLRAEGVRHELRENARAER